MQIMKKKILHTKILLNSRITRQATTDLSTIYIPRYIKILGKERQKIRIEIPTLLLLYYLFRNFLF